MALSKWRQKKEMFVIGCIDSHGAITANAYKSGRTHSAEESKGKRWRWCVWSQDFGDVFMGGQSFTTEELFLVLDWLVQRDFTDQTKMDEILSVWNKP